MARELCEDKSRDMASSSAGFCHPDISSTNPTIPTYLVNQIQGFVSDPEMFNLTAGMEMIGFSKNPEGPSSSTNFYHDSAAWQDNRLLVDDSSIRCVFPCEGNERPRQGLSLSLSSSNPSGIGLLSFELRHANKQQQLEDFVSSSSREGFFGKTPNLYQGHFLLKNSRYLVPAQELLTEFCSLGTKQSDILREKSHKNKQWKEDNGSGSSKKHLLISSLEFVELHKRKTKLLSMLEEVDRRYRHYCNQMKAVVSSFEAVAGNGAATVYSALALKAMSRHFKCLKDGILGQLEATRKGMGEKDPVAPGTTRGETPKLKIIDRELRQQKAFQQMNMMETHPWRPQRGLPEPSVSVLRAWLFEHFLHPYPSDVDKHILARQTGLSRSQVSNWFINARVRLWKPMVEVMYVEEMKGHENNGVCSSECVSSIMNNPVEKNDQNIVGGVSTDTFGSVELDFSGGMVCYKGGDVSLTLGLQQHGVSLGETQSSVFYQREQMDDCEAVEYSILEGEGQHLPYNKHLMGIPLQTHMLHDLAG